MNDRTERVDLEQVLEAYAASADGPSHASLVEWIRRYPEYEQELTEFAVAWSRMERLPTEFGGREVDTDMLVLRGMSIFQNIMHRKSAERAADQPLQGIASIAAEGGLSIDGLADLLELSAPIVRKLDLRRLAYPTLPGELKDRLVAALHRSPASVELYLQGPPLVGQRVRYKASKAPATPSQEDFFEAIRNDPDLSDDRRRRWLSLELPRRSGSQP